MAARLVAAIAVLLAGACGTSTPSVAPSAPTATPVEPTEVPTATEPSPEVEVVQLQVIVRSTDSAASFQIQSDDFFCVIVRQEYEPFSGAEYTAPAFTVRDQTGTILAEGELLGIGDEGGVGLGTQDGRVCEVRAFVNDLPASDFFDVEVEVGGKVVGEVVPGDGTAAEILVDG